MKETIAEYARIILVIISFAALCLFVFGGFWFGHLGKTMYNVENEPQKSLATLDEREHPILTMKSATSIRLGDSIDLKSLIKNATEKSEDGKTDIDAIDKVTIECNEPSYNDATNTLNISEIKTYVVQYKLTDTYGLTVTQTVRLTVTQT